jgi:TonB-linked SusC/RagA family outer membrane protein
MGRLNRLRSALGLAAVAASLGASALPLVAQATGTVHGTVTDATTRRPLSGAQVSVVGGTRRAVTNASGEFTLVTVPAGTVSLQADFLGYSRSVRSVTVAAGQTATVSFGLNTSSIALDAVVVTGTAGNSECRTLGNAVSTISASEATEKAPIHTVAELLQARTPGLTITQPSGSVGTATSFRLRGTGSLVAGVQPVVFIDGVRVRAGGQTGHSVSGQRTSALDALNPDDIESMEVIKGPAAATLYGAEAAAGVIQIITKKGKTGTQSLSWNAKMETGNATWALERPTTFGYCSTTRIRQSGIKAAGAYPGCAGVDSMTALNDPSRLISANILRDDPKALRDGSSLNYGLSVRGGGERYSFFLSGARDDETGIFPGNFFNRTSARGNFFASPRDNWDFSVSLDAARTNTRLPNNDNSSWGLLRNVLRSPAGRLGTFAVGYLGLGPDQINSYDNRTRTDRYILGITTNYQPAKWFRNRLTLGLDNNQRLATLFFSKDLTGLAPYGTDYATGAIDQYVPRNYDRTMDYAGTLTANLPKELTSNTSFGMQLSARRTEAYEAYGEGLVSDKVRLVANAANNHGFESFNEQNSLGFFVQQQVGWKDRLFLTGAVRVDDNSAFGTDFNRVYYPKAAVSYVISEEPWFHLPGVSELKLRSAWGRAGNSPAPFSADRNWTTAAAVANDGATALSALSSASYGNTLLKAETGSELEAGFEASLFQSRAGIDFTWYNKKTFDAIIPVSVAPSTGFGNSGYGTALQNVGDLSNRGMEVSVFGTPIQAKSFAWETRLNFSHNSNKLDSFNGSRTDPIQIGYAFTQRHAEGYPVAGFWGWDVKRNADGSPALTAAGLAQAGDTTFIGSALPTREMGFSNTFTLFRNLRLYAFLDYKGGFYQYCATCQRRDQDGNTLKETTLEGQLAANNKANPAGTNTAANMPADLAIIRSGSTLQYFSKADFVKLREVSVTYSLPTAMAHRFGSSAMSLSLSGRNLGLWTKYMGLDPEGNIEGDDDFIRYDYMTVPATRRVVATLNVSF